MGILLGLIAAIGLLPFAIAMVRLPAGSDADRLAVHSLAASTLLCALAFSLTFFIQEVGLVVPKALVPGLDPILYHNDHDWRGDAPIAELLQGGGAIATMASGLVFLWLAGRIGTDRPTGGLFAFWMAFQGLFQSLSQWAIGSLIAGNDVGRALTWLGLGSTARLAILPLAVIGLFAAGRALAQCYPFGGNAHNRTTAITLLATLALAIILIIPFRVPREPVEVVLIPLVVHIIGLGWLALGVAATKRAGSAAAAPKLAIPAAALLALLAFFQFVLRPGVAF
ncbi:hypothetical protein [Sphingopyxis panaciterrae]